MPTPSSTSIQRQSSSSNVLESKLLKTHHEMTVIYFAARATMSESKGIAYFHRCISKDNV